jgi:hypothetical protein
MEQSGQHACARRRMPTGPGRHRGLLLELQRRRRSLVTPLSESAAMTPIAESNTSTEPDDSHSETIARIDASYEWTSPGRWTPVCRPPARPSAVFDEARMRADLVRWFGPAGAHVDLWDTIVRENNRLREDVQK